MTLLDLLKRIAENQKIDLFNNNCTIVVLNMTKREIVNNLLTKFEKNFRKIINCEIALIQVKENLEITLQESF